MKTTDTAKGKFIFYYQVVEVLDFNNVTMVKRVERRSQLLKFVKNRKGLKGKFYCSDKWHSAAKVLSDSDMKYMIELK